MAEKSLNLMYFMGLPIQEAQPIPDRINPKRFTLDIIKKLSKAKDNLESSKKERLFMQEEFLI